MPSRRTARRIVDHDADLVLAIARGRPVPAAWRRPGFAARVEQARGQLGPIASLAMLADSFAREALHARPWTDRPSGVRIAYAIRWIEVGAGIRLPAWSALVPSLTRPVRPSPA